MAPAESCLDGIRHCFIRVANADNLLVLNVSNADNIQI